MFYMGYASFAEFIPANVRGKWSARLSFVGNWAPMLSAAVGVVLISAFSWRTMFLLGELWMFAAWFLSGISFLESPRWLAGKGRTDMAEPSLRSIESRIEQEKNITLNTCKGGAQHGAVFSERGSFWGSV